ncbi:MAG: hypothetical protein H0X33_13430 [Taibaiella sp.]|nr:hypothetical protein [Taibaiella sp.]
MRQHYLDDRKTSELVSDLKQFWQDEARKENPVLYQDEPSSEFPMLERYREETRTARYNLLWTVLFLVMLVEIMLVAYFFWGVG